MISGDPFLQYKPNSKNNLVRSYAAVCGCPAKEDIESTVECLRKTPLEVLTNQSAAWEGSQTSLGGLIKANVFEEIRVGKFPEVPIVVSVTRDEGTPQAIAFHPNNTKTTSIIIQSESRTSFSFVYYSVYDRLVCERSGELSEATNILGIDAIPEISLR